MTTRHRAPEPPPTRRPSLLTGIALTVAALTGYLVGSRFNDPSAGIAAATAVLGVMRDLTRGDSDED